MLLHKGGGKILPLGSRDATFGANFTELAETFRRSVKNHGPEWTPVFEEWLHTGAGHSCDACKTMMEKLQAYALEIMSEAIAHAQAQEKDYQGFRGHQVNVRAPSHLSVGQP